jgi:hypothetical protein
MAKEQSAHMVMLGHPSNVELLRKPLFALNSSRLPDDGDDA